MRHGTWQVNRCCDCGTKHWPTCTTAGRSSRKTRYYPYRFLDRLPSIPKRRLTGRLIQDFAHNFTNRFNTCNRMVSHARQIARRHRTVQQPYPWSQKRNREERVRARYYDCGWALVLAGGSRSPPRCALPGAPKWKGPTSLQAPLLPLKCLVAGTGFEPVTFGL